MGLWHQELTEVVSECSEITFSGLLGFLFPGAVGLTERALGDGILVPSVAGTAGDCSDGLLGRMRPLLEYSVEK